LKNNEFSNDILLKINARDRTYSYTNMELTPEKQAQKFYNPAKNI
jgi:hypothetical protein